MPDARPLPPPRPWRRRSSLKMQAGMRPVEPLSNPQKYPRPGSERFDSSLRVGRAVCRAAPPAAERLVEPGSRNVLPVFRILRMHWNHESLEIPLTRPLDTLSPSGGEGRGEGVRWFMESLDAMFGMRWDHEPRGWVRRRDSVLDCGSPLPLLHRKTGSKSARGLAQSKTWRQFGWFRERLVSFLRRRWDHEPVRPRARRRPRPRNQAIQSRTKVRFRESPDHKTADRCVVLPMWTQGRAPLLLRASLRQAHRASGDGVHIGAVNAAIAVDVPARVEGSSGPDFSGQNKRVEDIDASVAIDVCAVERTARRRVDESLAQPRSQRQTGRHGRPRKPRFPTRLRSLQSPQMFPGLPQHRAVQRRRDEDSFLLKMVQRFNQFFGRLKALFFRVLVLLGHTNFNELSSRRAEKVHCAKYVLVLGLFRRVSSALCSRDLTVPSGTSRATAISARLRPSTKRSSNTSRCSCESRASTAFRGSFSPIAGSVASDVSIVSRSLSSDCQQAVFRRAAIERFRTAG